MVYYPYEMSLKEHVLCFLAAIAIVVVIVGSLIGLMAFAGQPTAEQVERRAVFNEYMAGSSIARICADGTRIRQTARGELFVASYIGPAIDRVSSPVEMACGR